MRPPLRPPSVAAVRLVVLASILSTAFHYTDNYVSIETYPQPDWVSERGVIVAWLLLTAFGVAGYLLYRRGQLAPAAACLFVYSYTGLSSLGHFLSGSPDEFTTRGLISVLTDGVTGSAVLAVTAWSLLALRSRQPTRG